MPRSSNTVLALAAGAAACLLVAVPALSGSLLRIPFAAWVDTTGGRKNDTWKISMLGIQQQDIADRGIGFGNRDAGFVFHRNGFHQARLPIQALMQFPHHLHVHPVHIRRDMHNTGPHCIDHTHDLIHIYGHGQGYRSSLRRQRCDDLARLLESQFCRDLIILTGHKTNMIHTYFNCLHGSLRVAKSIDLNNH